eukprot:GAHX01000630.1.p1 GENE.GAHX01000630.1~~GAHX01000630.1.p1  ORF type:complete len:462 (-),score=71.30 GAHX01000630.1:133-1467(-)
MSDTSENSDYQKKMDSPSMTYTLENEKPEEDKRGALQRFTRLVSKRINSVPLHFYFFYFSFSTYFCQNFFIAAASDLVNKNISLVMFFLTSPQILLKFIGPSFLHKIKATTKMTIATLFTVSTVLIVYFSFDMVGKEEQGFKFFAISLAMTLSALSLVLNETTIMGWSADCPKTCINYWSMGSGVSGLFTTLISLGISFFELGIRTFILVFIFVPILNFIFFVVSYKGAGKRMKRKAKRQQRLSKSKTNEESKENNEEFSYLRKLRIVIIEMGYYFISLFVVYVSYSTIVSGAINSLSNKHKSTNRAFSFLCKVGVMISRTLPAIVEFNHVALFAVGNVTVLAATLGVVVNSSSLLRTMDVNGKEIANSNSAPGFTKFLILFLGFLLGLSHGGANGFTNLSIRTHYDEKKRRIGLSYISLACPIGQMLGTLLGLLLENIVVKTK